MSAADECGTPRCHNGFNVWRGSILISDLFTQLLAHCKVHNTPHLVEVVSSEFVAVTEEKAEECNQTNLREVGATSLILAEELPLDP